MRCIYKALFFLFLPLSGSAQTYTENIYLNTQAKVDSFTVLYPPMHRLTAALVIGTAPDCDIHDLSPLPHFSYIRELIVYNTQLTSLQSFAGVDSTYFCRILYNPLLQDLRGLHQLKFSYDSLSISHNASLTSLLGLDSIRTAYNVSIQKNDRLVSLSGAPQLNYAYNLTVYLNKRLKTLTGLSALQRCGVFNVVANDSLEHFGSFPQLDSLDSWLVLANPRLRDFAGFTAGHPLKTGLVSIQNNLSLENLSGLEQLAGISSVFYLIGNPVLRPVRLDSLRRVYLAEISGDLIDSIQFPALRSGVFKIHDCPSLLHLYNTFPRADWIRCDIYDNPALLSIHEDAGPKKLLRYNAGGPLLESVTGFDSTLVCAGRYNSWEPYEGLGIASPQLKKVTGFRNVRFGKVDLGKSYTTENMERVDGFDQMETAAGGLTFVSYDSMSTLNFEVGIQVLRGFQNLRRGIDGPIGMQSWVRDSLIGFQLLDSLIGYQSTSSVGWRASCYVDPQAFAQLSYSEAHFGAGGEFSWPLPKLQKIYRGLLILDGNAQPNRFEGMFPVLKTTGGVSARHTPITSLRGLEGIVRFDQSAFGDPYIRLESNPNLSDCSAVCAWLQNATFHPPYLNDQTVIITDNTAFPCSDKATLMSWCDTVTALQSPWPAAADLRKAGQLLVYPNPVQQGTLYFRLPEAARGTACVVRAYDMQGRVKAIRTGLFSTDFALAVGDWPMGTYVLQVQTAERVWSATVQVSQAP